MKRAFLVIGALVLVGMGIIGKNIPDAKPQAGCITQAESDAKTRVYMQHGASEQDAISQRNAATIASGRYYCNGVR
jgi:hypothetical protein